MCLTLCQSVLRICTRDGQVMRPMYTATIKSPDQSKYASDDYVITGSVAADQVWRPAAQSKCPLLKAQ